MFVPTVRLYIRVTLPDGSRPYLDPVYAGNQKLKEGCAMYCGQPQRFDNAVYYLLYLKNRKRCWDRLTADAQHALLAKKRVEAQLADIATGVIEPDAPQAVHCWSASRPTLLR